MKLSAMGTFFPNQQEDPAYGELIVDDVYIGTFHLTDPDSGMDQFIYWIYDDALELLTVDGRNHFYRKLSA
jgi:hypothetical protein